MPKTRQKVRAAPADPLKPRYKAIAPETRWTALWAGVRCAPSKVGATNPQIPTITKTRPRTLQTVFAIFLDPPVKRLRVATNRVLSTERTIVPNQRGVFGNARDCTPNRFRQRKSF